MVTVVARSRVTQSSISRLIVAAVMGSRPDVGSSKNRNSGSAAMARGDRRALLHAARQFGREEIGRALVQPDLGKLGARDLVGFCTPHRPGVKECERDVFPDGEGVEKRASLEQHSRASHERLRPAGRQFVPGGACEPHGARIQGQQPEGALETHGLSRAGGADDRERITCHRGQVHAVKNGLPAEALDQPAELDCGSLGRPGHREKKASVMR